MKVYPSIMEKTRIYVEYDEQNMIALDKRSLRIEFRVFRPSKFESKTRALRCKKCNSHLYMYDEIIWCKRCESVVELN